MLRFTGTVAYLAEADVRPIVDWITAIPFEDWPQQTPIDDGLRPAMVNDPEWHGFGAMVAPLVAELLEWFPGAKATNLLLTVIMPGHGIPTHTDTQPDHWVCRVHAPLTTNDVSRFVVGGKSHHMEVGKAYLVNTEPPHGVANDGDTPRVHFMFDVHA